MSRNMHKFEELTPFEFDQEKDRASIIYVAAGPVEYHEECNALGIDPLKGYHWCLDAAEITGGIVFPLVPFAPAGKAPFLNAEQIENAMRNVKFGEYTSQPLVYPGVFSSGELCRALYGELLKTFAIEHKFKLCVFFGSHGPAGALVKQMTAEAGGTFYGMHVMAVGSNDYNKDIIQKFNLENGIARSNHGGLWEAAINYAIKPEYFQPELLDDTKYPQHYGSLAQEHFEGCLRPTISEFAKFDPAFARELYDTTVERFAADVLNTYRKL